MGIVFVLCEDGAVSGPSLGESGFGSWNIGSRILPALMASINDVVAGDRPGQPDPPHTKEFTTESVFEDWSGMSEVHILDRDLAISLIEWCNYLLDVPSVQPGFTMFEPLVRSIRRWTTGVHGSFSD